MKARRTGREPKSRTNKAPPRKAYSHLAICPGLRAVPQYIPVNQTHDNLPNVTVHSGYCAMARQNRTEREESHRWCDLAKGQPAGWIRGLSNSLDCSSTQGTPHSPSRTFGFFSPFSHQWRKRDKSLLNDLFMMIEGGIINTQPK